MTPGMNLFLWTNRVGPEHFPLFERLAATGFQLLELPCADYSSAEIAAIRNALQTCGLSCSVATLLQANCNPISPDQAVRRAALTKLQRDIDLCAALGAEALIGPMHSAHKQFTGWGPTESEFQYCRDLLREAGEYAAEAGIQLSVEFLNRFECYFLNTSEQAFELVEAIDLDNVGILYDTHHAHLEESNQAEALLRSAPRINQIHISESHRGTPGSGGVDWSGVFSAINSSGFDGRVVIEAFGTAIPDIANAVNIWRNNFSSEEAVYREGFEWMARHIPALDTGQSSSG